METSGSDQGLIAKLLLLLTGIINYVLKLLKEQDEKESEEVEVDTIQSSTAHTEPIPQTKTEIVQQAPQIDQVAFAKPPVPSPPVISNVSSPKPQLTDPAVEVLTKTPVSSVTTAATVTKQPFKPIINPLVLTPIEAEVQKVVLDTPEGDIGERLKSARKEKERTVYTLGRKKPVPKRSKVTLTHVFNPDELAKIEEQSKKTSEVDVPKGDFEKLERISHAEIWRKELDPRDKPIKAPSSAPPPPNLPPPMIDNSSSSNKKTGTMGVSLNDILGIRSGLKKTGEVLK
ncbi:TRI1 [Acrasis kona]|uniref:TRI1 n=1 Tax=Acrasis kona TaxID=1008807 RepID=A0AAW2Z404_9EUKA